MILTTNYHKQLKLLLEIMPYVFDEECFCLKGGTAINLFLLDLPRVSVDIDLVYLPKLERTEALIAIDHALTRIKESLIKNIVGIRVFEKYTKEHSINKLFVESKGTQVVIEPNTVLRGSLYPVKRATLCQSAEELFQIALSDIPILHPAEIYAGKICAALDRQHPRDLFDIKLLYESFGLTREIISAFVIYLASGPRPMHELLDPNMLDVRKAFDYEFVGMSKSEIAYEGLIDVRQRLVSDIIANLTSNDKEFLISVKEGNPKYHLTSYQNLDSFAALQWKIRNINLMESVKRNYMLEKLSKTLFQK